jgi:hypothetical protein
LAGVHSTHNVEVEGSGVGRHAASPPTRRRARS